MSKTLIIFFTFLFLSCGTSREDELYINGRPKRRLITGTFVNSHSPLQDTLRIDSGFTLITKDKEGKTIKMHGKYFEYFPRYSDAPGDGTGWARFKSPDDIRTWSSIVHIESVPGCPYQLVLDTFLQYINFTPKEEIAGKVDSLSGIKRNAQGLPYRFVKCLP
jgi:hypothetical protein